MLVADTLDVVLAVSVAQQGGTLGRLDGDDLRAVALLEPVARRERARRARGRGVARQPEVRVVRALGLVDRLERAARDGEVAQVVRELGELVEDHALRVLVDPRALVVDLLHVALGAGRADDVVRRVEAPLLQPGEPLAAHPGGQHRDAVAAEDARDGDPAAAVVASGGPDGAVGGRVELPRHDARHEAAVGGEDFVRVDHREAVAEGHQDARVHAGERGGQREVARGRRLPAAGGVVVPVHAEEVERVGGVGVDRGELLQHVRVDLRRLGQLGKRRQRDLLLAEPGHRAAVDAAIDDLSHHVQPCHERLRSLLYSASPAGFRRTTSCRPSAR